MDPTDIHISENIINMLINKALESNLKTKMAAIPMRNNKKIGNPYCNKQNRIYENRKIVVNCGHAEREALDRNNLIINKRKRKKARGSMNTKPNAILVIRISENNPNFLMNARPCRSCLKNMKACGIKKVYYSANNRIYVENLSCMLNIKDSIFSRKLYQDILNYPTDFKEYVKNSIIELNNSITDMSHLNIFIELCIDRSDFDIFYIIGKKDNKKFCKIILDNEILAHIHII